MKAKTVPLSAIGSASDPIITKKPNKVRFWKWVLHKTIDGRYEGSMETDDPDYLYFLGRESSLEPTVLHNRSYIGFPSVKQTIGILGESSDGTKHYNKVLVIDGVQITEWPY